jgi:hypothetical protein
MAGGVVQPVGLERRYVERRDLDRLDVGEHG